MRWFWRADPPTLLLDGLLEGSLVCAAYLVLALGWSTNAPLPLPVFWLAATAGLLSARQPRSRWRDFFSVGALTIVAGLIGWLWDDGARQALLSRADPATVLGAHWAGWILGIAVLRGAVHSDTRWESEISSDAITYSLPILAFALVLYLGSGRTFPPMAAIAVAVAIVAAMLSIGLARTREMEAMGPASQGGRVWRAISGTILILAAIGVPIALALGTLAQEPIFRAARWSWGVAGAIGAWLAHWIEWLASQFLNGGHGAGPSSAPSPTAQSSGAAFGPVTPQPGPVAPWVDFAARVLLVAVAISLLVGLHYLTRRWRARARARTELALVPEARTRASIRSRLRAALPRLLRPRRPRLPTLRHRPMSAADAYLAALADFSERPDLARGPAETPRAHALRLGRKGPPGQVPLGLLAADYQLAVYGEVPISDRETARAVGRWHLLRKLARRRRR